MRVKTSIRYFNNTPIRARFDSTNMSWWYSASDVVFALTGSNNSRRYWNTYKSRHIEIANLCKQEKLTAFDGKSYLSDLLDENGISLLVMSIKSNHKMDFVKWVSGLGSSLDEASKAKAYDLYDSGAIKKIEVGTTNGLKQIHLYLFDGLYPFAGSIRDKNISKGGFVFANCIFLEEILHNIDKMSEDSFEQIVDKYIEMNIAHPFLEGNGRATRIWLDLMLNKNLKQSIDWSKIDKSIYLKAMEASSSDSSNIKNILRNALTKDIDNHMIYMKGIDYSYYYEEIKEEKN